MSEQTTTNPELEALEADKLRIEIEKLRHESAQAAYKAERELSSLEDFRRATEHQRTNRTFHFVQDVTDRHVSGCAGQLEDWHRADVADGVDPRPMTLVFDSPGGAVLSGFHLFDEIRQWSAKGHHITTVVRGMAGSMAGVLVQAGDTRLIGAESRLHIHEPSGGSIGKLNEMQDRAELLDSMFRQMADIYALRSTMSAEEIYVWVKYRERVVRAEEAVQLGLVDRIG